MPYLGPDPRWVEEQANFRRLTAPDPKAHASLSPKKATLILVLTAALMLTGFLLMDHFVFHPYRFYVVTEQGTYRRTDHSTNQLPAGFRFAGRVQFEETVKRSSVASLQPDAIKGNSFYLNPGRPGRAYLLFGGRYYRMNRLLWTP